MRSFIERASEYLAYRRRRQTWMQAVGVLACIVAFCTIYALILPAITLEAAPAVLELDCAYEAHTHTAACYGTDGELICGQADFVVHAHDESCYDASGKLVCPLPEIAEHVHSEDCYIYLPAEPEAKPTPAPTSAPGEGELRLICGQEESEPHTHTGDCYEIEQELACGLEETEGHTHTDACYEQQQICGQEEAEAHTHTNSCYKVTRTLLCVNDDEDHVHTDACYDIEEELICDLEETEGHTHTDACYEDVLICEQEEAEPHTHDESCYRELRTLTCELEETKGHTHTDECYAPAEPAPENTVEEAAGDGEEPACERVLVCTKDEVILHTHTAACYDAGGELTCGQLEVLEHQHGPECFRTVEPDDTGDTDDKDTAGDGTGSKDPADSTTGDKDDDTAAGDKDTDTDQSDKDDAQDGSAQPDTERVSLVLEAALAQLGYAEEEDGYTLYGDYYGLPYEPWDAMFVAYCMEQANVTDIPLAQDYIFDHDIWMNALLAEDICHEAWLEEPMPGDLAFFDLDGDLCADFVAIVEKTTGTTLYVIAGDTSDCVRRTSYSLEDERLLGYARMPAEEQPVDEDDAAGGDDSMDDGDGVYDGDNVDDDPTSDTDSTDGDDDTTTDDGDDATGDSTDDGDGTTDGTDSTDDGDGTDDNTTADDGDGTDDDNDTTGQGSDTTNPQPGRENRSPLLEAALAQLGYTEDEDGYTLYGDYYSLPYEPWNLLFIAYCMEQADVTDVPPAQGSLFDYDAWIGALLAADLYREAGLYTPAPGDLTFFDLDGDHCADFAAVVEKTTETTLYVIAGDTSDCVRRVSYSLEDERLLGYARMPAEEQPAGSGSISDDSETAGGSGTSDVVLTTETETLALAAVYEEGVLPFGTTVHVTCYDEESDEFDAIGQQLGEELAESGHVLASIYPVNVRFEDTDGSEVEPDGFVTVTVTFAEPIAESGKDASRWAVFHLAADGTVEELAGATVARYVTADGWFIAGYTFRSDSFSDYVLAEQDAVMALAEGETVTEYKLWLWWAYGADALNSKISAASFDGDNAIRNAVLQGPNADEYLIPVSYFEQAFAGYGYVFDAEAAQIDPTSPFIYAPSAYYPTEDLAAASYVEYDGAWYVQVKDTGNYGENAPPRNNVYYISPVEVIQELDSFYLWLHEATHSGAWELSNSKVFDYSTRNSDGLTDVLKCTANQISYLIPISYFTDNFGAYGYSFDENAACPLLYAPSASDPTANLTLANYKKVGEEWYVQVQDTGTYENGVPRSNLYYYHYEVETDTKDHSGTVINVFDYWVREDETDEDGNILSGRFLPDTEEYNNWDSGINAGYALKFLKNAGTWMGENGIPSSGQEFNVWTGNKEVYTGIVNKTLTNGYPTLSAKIDAGQTSLAYLFDPSTENAYKKSYTNVTGLLQLNNQGYYVYNSQENYAEFDGEDHFTLYTVPGVYHGGSSPDGQFFPFNSMTQVGEMVSTDEPLNHYFGLTLTSRFYQQNGGQSSGSDMIFEFSGDDDVWIFIDGVLVADLGGNHDAAHVEINFATGKIDITASKLGDKQPATLYEAFEAAGELGKVTWNGNTFADRTTHTLSFFYLERGNTDSNLSLTFNLVEIPVTSIFKVNQYGQPVPGATFEVYKADPTTWEVIDDEPVYRDTTDVNGEIIFVNNEGNPYTLEELENEFGSHFILRETEVPDGYRKVSGDICLYIENNLLLCDNSYTSGAWATSTLLATATKLLYPVVGEPIRDYYDFENKTIDGTLFAVVLKRIGNNVTAQDSWAPVYGNATEGYTICYPDGYFIDAVIDAAQHAEKYGAVEFSLSAISGVPQVELTNLPGDIQTYYYVNGGDPEATQYTVAYYYTTADSLSNATAENTVRIDADENSANSYTGFARTFGATILVPNLSNRLMVQKLNETGDLTNGATFALYEVGEDENKKIFYIAADNARIYLNPDTDGDNKGSASVDGESGCRYEIDSETGVITVTTASADETEYTIKPVNIGTTRDETSSDAGENGTYTFKNLGEGWYYLREIAAPDGYKINPTEIMVLVDEEAIYANAGTGDDGVTVARGPGYLVKSLSQFASEGEIDNTLTWVYEQMRISVPELTFSDFTDDYTNWLYLAQNHTGETASDSEGGLKVYLQYDPAGDNTLFNYTINEGRYNGNIDGVSRRLYTTVGWSYYELYQDYDYGSDNRSSSAAYEDLGGQEIANLFSRSTYIQVTDEPDCYELPETGGTGTWAYTLGGIALLGGAACWYAARRRKGAK